MDINNIDERILWEDIRGEAVNTILGLVECWSLMPYEIEFAKHCFHRCKQRFGRTRNGQSAEHHPIDTQYKPNNQSGCQPGDITVYLWQQPHLTITLK